MLFTVICYLHHYDTQGSEDFPGICFRNTEVFCNFTFLSSLWQTCHEITEAADSGSNSILYCIAFTCKRTQIITSKLNSCRDVKVFSMDSVLSSASWWFWNSQVWSPWGAFCTDLYIFSVYVPVSLHSVCPWTNNNWHCETVFHNKNLQSVSVPYIVLPTPLLVYLLINIFSDAAVTPCHLQ